MRINGSAGLEKLHAISVDELRRMRKFKGMSIEDIAQQTGAAPYQVYDHLKENGLLGRISVGVLQIQETREVPEQKEILFQDITQWMGSHRLKEGDLEKPKNLSIEEALLLRARKWMRLSGG